MIMFPLLLSILLSLLCSVTRFKWWRKMEERKTCEIIKDKLQWQPRLGVDYDSRIWGFYLLTVCVWGTHCLFLPNPQFFFCTSQNYLYPKAELGIESQKHFYFCYKSALVPLGWIFNLPFSSQELEIMWTSSPILSNHQVHPQVLRYLPSTLLLM